jgi:hypothetical protein
MPTSAITQAMAGNVVVRKDRGRVMRILVASPATVERRDELAMSAR